VRPLAPRSRHQAWRGSTTQVGNDKKLNLLGGVDNEAVLTWLESALEHAFARRSPRLWAYLEAVMEEVLFEMEIETASE
jgi:hypothetical protein